MIAFLHTSEIHIDRFENLVMKYNSEIPIKHFVNEELLSVALSNGKLDTVSFKNEIEIIKKESPLLIICTCSTYREECDQYPDIYRIDEPVVIHLISKYQKIGLAYTAISTKKISENLLLKTAKSFDKNIEIIDCNCTESWRHFEEGAIDLYEKSIALKIKEIASETDVIFLAQASMEGAKKYLASLEQEVFSSPEFGVKTYLNTLKSNLKH